MRNLRLSSRGRPAAAALLLTGALIAGEATAASAQVVPRRSSPSAGMVVRSRPAPRRVYARRQFPYRVSRAAFRSRPRLMAAAPSVLAAIGDDVWAKLRRCESGGRYDISTGNGFYGAYQFTAGTWHGLGYPGLPHQAAPEVQDEAARRLQARSGWGQWPACSRRIGAR
jgi:hypothetical protein